MNERIEGWGSIENSPNAHYFREGRSLCGGWLAFGPRWESSQGRGPEPKPRSGTCKGCWKKAPETAPAREGDDHMSDCATHNEPAYPNGPCDCRPAPEGAPQEDAR